MVLHDINQAIKYSHNIIIMKNGRIIKNGSAKNIINRELLKDVYKVDGVVSTLDKDTYFIPTRVCNM